MSRPLLFSRYPALKSRIPFTPFGNYPSAVEHLDNLSRHTGSDIWIKRDDCASSILGGNKCRMMEWVIPDAVNRGRKSLVSWGALGSNQVLASSIFGKRAGFDDITAIYSRQPCHDYVRENFLISTTLGVVQKLGQNSVSFALRLAGSYIWKLITGGKPYLIPLVGSSPVSVLSHFDAALELEQQIRSGECPRPDRIFVTVGTGGTAAGLILGSMVLGNIGEVVGVSVIEKTYVNKRMIAWEINRAVRYLKRRGVNLGVGRVKASDINLVQGYMGSAYAEPTSRGLKAIDLLKDLEDITLDVTYTSKTMAAMLDCIREHENGRFLFWHTKNTIDMKEYTEHLPDISELDRCFRKYLEKREK